LRYDVVISEDAENDLKNIWRYIAEHESVTRAEYVFDALERTCAQLDESPRRGNHPKELLKLGITEFRELHWKPYRIVYRLIGRRAVILCVLDGRRDMQTLLQQRLVR